MAGLFELGTTNHGPANRWAQALARHAGEFLDFRGMLRRHFAPFLLPLVKGASADSKSASKRSLGAEFLGRFYQWVYLRFGIHAHSLVFLDTKVKII